MSKEEHFELLFLAYWHYVYQYEVGRLEDFNPDEPVYQCQRDDFMEQLVDDGMLIKVTQGY